MFFNSIGGCILKINIVTFHRALNCGAVLQAYALSTYFDEMQHDVSIVDYCPPWTEESQVLLKNLFNHFTVKNTLLFLFQRAFRRKCNEFLDKYCSLTKRVKTVEEFKILPESDMFVTGSDQVWNSDITSGVDNIYLLDFQTTARKISYAASCGNDDISDKMINPIVNSVRKYHAISVREHTLELALKLKGIDNVYPVWDPVFLLDSDNYLGIQKKTYFKNYLLIYTKGQPEGIRELAKKVADEYGLKIVDMSKIKKKWPANYVKSVYGPREFLGLFANADYIVTNSFHGTAFSIIFRKSFYSLGAQNRTSRLSSLLEDIGLINRLISRNESLDEITQIDYSKYENTINDHINKSKDFLMNALQ